VGQRRARLPVARWSIAQVDFAADAAAEHFARTL